MMVLLVAELKCKYRYVIYNKWVLQLLPSSSYFLVASIERKEWSVKPRVGSNALKLCIMAQNRLFAKYLVLLLLRT